MSSTNLNTWALSLLQRPGHSRSKTKGPATAPASSKCWEQWDSGSKELKTTLKQRIPSGKSCFPSFLPFFFPKQNNRGHSSCSVSRGLQADGSLGDCSVPSSEVLGGSPEPPAQGNAECQPGWAEEELTFGEERAGASDYAWLNTSLHHMALQVHPKAAPLIGACGSQECLMNLAKWETMFVLIPLIPAPHWCAGISGILLIHSKSLIRITQ